MTLSLFVHGTDDQITLSDFPAIVAGYTGRDQDAVREHIAELAAIGVPAPPRTPMFYSVDPRTVTTEDEVRVPSGATSGEVEPVYIRHRGQYYLGVGSDHTDRELETKDIADAKRVCPKPLGQTVMRMDPSRDEILEGAVGESYADDHLYQSDSLAGLLSPGELLSRMEKEIDLEGQDYVCFGGTLPLVDGTFRYAERWNIAIRFGQGESSTAPRILTHYYRVVIER